MSVIIAGPFCPVDLPSSDLCSPYCVRISTSFDADGHERGERINGFNQCPKCSLWWPCVEEPDCWTEDGLDENGNVMWKATGWWGAAVCEECNLLMVDQPDGTPMCFKL
jgi:hypothetical protein